MTADLTVRTDVPLTGGRAFSLTRQVAACAQLPPLQREHVKKGGNVGLWSRGFSAYTVLLAAVPLGGPTQICLEFSSQSLVPSSAGLKAERKCSRTAASPAASWSAASLGQRVIMGGF